MDKSRSLSLIAAALIVSLSGCKQEAPATTDSASTAASEAGAGISARDGKLLLPAVAGRPGAAYFTVRNDSGIAAALTGVAIAGAGKAQMHETSGGSMKAVNSLPIASGAEIEFAPGGLHVMVFDLSPTLKAGQSTDLTLTFANGETIKMPVMIDSIGGNGDDMEGMGPMPNPSSPSTSTPSNAVTGASAHDHGSQDHGGHDAAKSDAMASMPGMDH
ncbi:copper chaperone PCu(A)C [uncultured Novosphingobium sp.]|uniref:copper chaperone PCu(A)C n=1 Tax=uncultured Novosphingobium sp. TaxID=292277 RepID=UPI00259A66EB|nr:copper chaperone PCu(A)C [uncultured Novosphingobium sp.]